jgi:hypothetical protein
VKGGLRILYVARDLQADGLIFVCWMLRVGGLRVYISTLVQRMRNDGCAGCNDVNLWYENLIVGPEKDVPGHITSLVETWVERLPTPLRTIHVTNRC